MDVFMTTERKLVVFSSVTQKDPLLHGFKYSSFLKVLKVLGNEFVVWFTKNSDNESFEIGPTMRLRFSV
jgi:hypothetical protein